MNSKSLFGKKQLTLVIAFAMTGTAQLHAQEQGQANRFRIVPAITTSWERATRHHPASGA